MRHGRPQLCAVAAALNKGEFALAAICAVHLRLPTLRRDEIEKLAKTGYNPDEPRDSRGRWTTGDASASDDNGDTSEDSHGSENSQAQFIPVQAIPLSPGFDVPGLSLPDWLTNPMPLIDPVPGSLNPYSPPNNLTDEQKTECKREYERAKETCKLLEEKGEFRDPHSSFGPTLDDCIEIMLSPECGGPPTPIPDQEA